MVLLPGAASAQVVQNLQQYAGTAGDPAVPGVPGDAPQGPAAPNAPLPNLPVDPTKILPVPGAGAPGLTGADDDHLRRDDTPDSKQIDDPKPPDHASGAVGDIDLGDSDLLDITKYDATIEDNGETHSDSTVLGLGGGRIVGSSASSEGNNRDGGNLTSVLCDVTSGALCLSLLYHDVVATEDNDSSLAAARGGVLALCLLGDDKDTTATYECDGLLSLGVAEGLGVAERDKEHGHTKAESANELLNLCIGKREKLTEACDGLGLSAVHSDSESKSKEPDTQRGSYLLGIDSSGESSYLLDEPEAIGLLDGCGDSALLCLLLNQGKSVIFDNPKGAGSAQEMLRLDVLNRTLLVVLGQAETLVHETEGRDHHKPQCDDKIDNDNDGDIDFPKDKDCESPQDDSEHGDKGEGNGGGAGDEGGLAETGAEIMPLLAGGLLLTGAGALTVAATRRRAGKHLL
ncbi:MAG TPA: hypothetical protein VJT72_15380 [Pseudonocardiaceae bacterium]|nr:hypothetical protein [Pseudonocardiaceae bacterium]